MGVVLLGRIFQAVIILVSLRVITSLVSPDEMGRLTLILALFSFVGLSFLNPVGMFINRRLHGWVENGRVLSYMRYFVAYLLVLSVLSALMIFVVSQFYDLVPNMELGWVIALVTLTITFATLNGAFISYLNLIGHPRWFIALTLVTAIANLSISAILVTNWRANAELWQAGQILGQAIIGIVAIIVFYRVLYPEGHTPKQKHVRLTKEKILSMYAFAWPLAIAVLLTWVQTQLYRFFIPEMLGIDVLGLFIVGYGVGAAFMTMMESILSAHFLPGFYAQVSSELENDKRTAWRDYASVMLPCLLLLAVGVSVLADDLVHILLAEKYHSAVQFVMWGAVVEAMRIATSTYAMAAHAHMQTGKLIVQHLFGAVIAPVSVYFLVPMMGGEGIGIGLAVAGSISLLVSVLVMKYNFSVNTPWQWLIRSFLMSAGLILASIAIHDVLAIDVGTVSSFLWLLFMGGILILLLFLTIRPYLFQQDETSIKASLPDSKPKIRH